MILAMNPINNDEAENKKYGGCDEVRHGVMVESQRSKVRPSTFDL
jgi:hypothetical protein